MKQVSHSKAVSIENTRRKMSSIQAIKEEKLREKSEERERLEAIER